MRTLLVLWLATACDFHEQLRPVAPRISGSELADVALHHVGYDNVTLSVTVDVTNRSAGELAVDPGQAQLQIGDQRTGTVRLTDGDGSQAARGTISGGRAGSVAGPAGSVAGAAVGMAGGVVDGLVLLGLNELARGPYTHFTHRLRPGERKRFTFQFPVKTAIDDLVCVPPYDSYDRCGQTVAVGDARLELGAGTELELFDRTDPHLGLGPPSAPHAVFVTRMGGGPGFGRTEGVGGIELAAGPRWGRLALEATAAFAWGFPLGGEARVQLVDRSLVHLSSTIGGAYWYFPSHHAWGPRAGIELGFDLGDKVLTWPSRALALGLYARGGPVIYRGDHAVGGELDFGLACGYY